MSHNPEASVGDPLSELERAFMAEFLQDRGHTLESVRMLPPAEAHALLSASLSLAELAAPVRNRIQFRAGFVDDMHRPGAPRTRRE